MIVLSNLEFILSQDDDTMSFYLGFNSNRNIKYGCGKYESLRHRQHLTIFYTQQEDYAQALLVILEELQHIVN